MNIIIDRPPETVVVGGAEYPINWDFRTSMLFELLVLDDELSHADKIREALELYYPIIPDDPVEAVEKILWFYKCGKDQKGPRWATEDAQSVRPVYSFDHDANYIYAAFLEQYGIDLQDAEDFHWWKFRALFWGLSENCEFVKIMGYRSIKLTGKMSKEQRQFYKKMQTIHALPLSRKESEENDRLVEALMNGGDLTGLI